MMSIEEKIKKYDPSEILIFSHADHDGICAALGLTYLFGEDIEVHFSKPFMPKEIPNIKNKKLFIICDLQLNEWQINNILDKGLEVINFDHHDIIENNHYNYTCLNPKKIFKKELISSSGLVWKLFKPKKISWILGAGASGDVAVEDTLDLFEQIRIEKPDLIKSLDIKSIYDSKIYEIAQIILTSFNFPNKAFDILKECIDFDSVCPLYDSELYDKYLEKKEVIESFFREEKDKIFNFQNFVIINSSDKEFSGSYSVFLNLKNKDDRHYIEYDNGRMFFRNFFGEKDIRETSKLFGGGGPHKRSGGAYTKQSFNVVLNKLKEFYFQTKLFDFV